MKDPRYFRLFLWNLLLITVLSGLLPHATQAVALPVDLHLGVQQSTPFPETSPKPFTIEAVNPYYSVGYMTLPDGKDLAVDIIGGPPASLSGVEVQVTASDFLREDAVLLPSFPSYDWVFGCSAVSGAMIAGYYDNIGYPNIYTGPANGGVMPITDTGWPLWMDGFGGIYPNNPLVASHNGVDGRTSRGSIDDYWVRYGSPALDPFITNGWVEHDWDSAIGDFMKTSQSKFDNEDGSTIFWSRDGGAKIYCSEMPYLYIPEYGGYIHEADGTYGRKLFFEARGYAVTECFSQRTDNQNQDGLGFTLQDYKTEIDAGHPVFLNLTGHSVVGFGYSGSTIYIRNTWDSEPSNLYAMPWGGSYDGMDLRSVSIVKLASDALPADFGKALPIDTAAGVSTHPTIIWESSERAQNYEYCVDTADDDVCTTGWVDHGANTSADLINLDPGTTYFWQVRAINGSEMTYADGEGSAFWQFQTKPTPPGAFAKISPIDGATMVASDPTLIWQESSDAERYEYCVDIMDDDTCTSGWVDNGVNTSVNLSGLAPGKMYFWQVRVVNAGGIIYANGGENNYSSFMTAYRVYLPNFVRQ